MIRTRLDALGRTLIIVNPVAQSGAADAAAERLQRFLNLYSHTDSFDLARTERPEHATKIAADAQCYDTVLALGGDGVVHEVANGLMRIDPARRPTLGVIPVGSGNDFARTLGITDIADVRGTDFGALLASEPMPIDVLKITYEAVPLPHLAHVIAPVHETVYAVQTVSFGLDAAIAADTQLLRKTTRLSGAPLYTASGMRCVGRGYRDFPARRRIDGCAAQDLRTVIFAIQNGPTYGSGYHICPDADPTDGALDICYAKGPVPRAVALPVFLSAKNGKHVGSKHIVLQRAHTVELEFAEDTYPIQLDGEIIRARSMHIEVVHHALSVLKPAR